MNKKIYTTPCMEQVELMLEQCIAASTTETAVSGIDPEPWTEGNTDWW